MRVCVRAMDNPEQGQAAAAQAVESTPGPGEATGFVTGVKSWT